MIRLVESEEHYDRVVTDLIAGARYRLDIATATLKAMIVLRGRKGESIAKFLSRRARDGLQIRILHSGVPSGYFLEEAKKSNLSNLPNFQMRRCVRVHQKTVLADGRDLYMGSANLTGAGLGAKSPLRRNFELGIITDEITFIDRVDSLFELIWCGDMCGKCKRRDSCPVPLEEI